MYNLFMFVFRMDKTFWMSRSYLSILNNGKIISSLVRCWMVYVPTSIDIGWGESVTRAQKAFMKYIQWVLYVFIPPLHRRGVYCFTSVRPKIFFVAFFSATIDDRNLIFGHKLHSYRYPISWEALVKTHQHEGLSWS